jgi:ubiquinone biosynthesis O-methyltransferase
MVTGAVPRSAPRCRARGLDPAAKVMIEVGCGGGLMAEEIARLGAAVIGVDPSAASIATAQAHAAASSLAIDYRIGSGEDLPAGDACADAVYCVDVLEHVADLHAVIGETARVLKPGGLYLFDTINRTRLSKLVMIKLSQEWAATAWMPPGLHDRDQFITPAELRRPHSRVTVTMPHIEPGVRGTGCRRWGQAGGKALAAGGLRATPQNSSTSAGWPPAEVR